MLLYHIDDPGRRPAKRFSKHLRSIRNQSPGLPIAEHFNFTAHSLDDIVVCGLKQCTVSNTYRKQQQTRVISLSLARSGSANLASILIFFVCVSYSRIPRARDYYLYDVVRLFWI